MSVLRGSVLVLTLFAFPAHAGLQITLVPPPDTYVYNDWFIFPSGTVVTVDVYGQLTPSPGTPPALLVESLQLYFGQTSAAPNITMVPTHPSAGQGPIDFWSFSSTVVCALDAERCGENYLIDDSLIGDELLSITYTAAFHDATHQIRLSQDSPTLLGSFILGMPNEPGVYEVDVIGPGQGVSMGEAQLRAGFLGPEADIFWRASEGDITGGVLRTTVPEFECCPLLVLVGACMLRRSIQ